MEFNADTPLVSVVIPVFNREETITYCLKSVLAQTYRNLEVIIVDDGSTDDSISVIRKFTDSRLKIIENTRGKGAQAARNAGIAAASGNWIAFQDSDDEWLPNKLRNQVALLYEQNMNPGSVVHSNCIRYEPETGYRVQWNIQDVSGFRPEYAVLSQPGPMFQGMLVSRQALTEIGLLDEAVPSYQEWETSIRLARHNTFIHQKDPQFVYYLSKVGTISGDERRDYRGYEYVVSKHQQRIIDVCGMEALENHHFQLLKRCMDARSWVDADRYLEKLKGSSHSGLFVLRVLRSLRLAPSALREPARRLLRSTSLVNF